MALANVHAISAIKRCCVAVNGGLYKGAAVTLPKPEQATCQDTDCWGERIALMMNAFWTLDKSTSGSLLVMSPPNEMANKVDQP